MKSEREASPQAAATMVESNIKGGLHLKKPGGENWTLFVAVITFFFPIFCANNYYTFLICGKDNSKAPWATRPQFGLRVAKALSCDTDESKKISGEPPPELWCWEEAGSQKFAVRPRNFCDPASSQHYISGGGGGGGFTGIFFRLVSITAKCFSYPQTNLEAHRSRCLWVIFATN